ncbi:MAG: hypothetical protein LBD01_04605 [Puniceicoccales bacterium]|jgi:hypothetical protein|nr:hypothetical protein [Puniceicoccales bacterium]
MRATLKWLPCIATALLWARLGALAQVWTSQLGLLLYTDGALLLFAVRFMPRFPAVLLLLLGTLLGDASRTGSIFGLSASLFLPVLLFLHSRQEKLVAWPWVQWLFLVVGINAVACATSMVLWTFRLPAACFAQPAWPVIHSGVTLLALAGGLLASSLFILLLGYWFEALQCAVAKWAGNKLSQAHE